MTARRSLPLGLRIPNLYSEGYSTRDVETGPRILRSVLKNLNANKRLNSAVEIGRHALCMNLGILERPLHSSEREG